MIMFVLGLGISVDLPMEVFLGSMHFQDVTNGLLELFVVAADAIGNILEVLFRFGDFIGTFFLIDPLFLR